MGIPLIVVNSRGMIGTIRVDSPDHMVLDMKKDNPVYDLRVTVPFPELLEYATTGKYADLTSLDSVDHSHIPFVVILIQALREWQSAHPGEKARKTQHKNELKKIIEKMWKSPSEVNFEEAYNNCSLYAVKEEQIPYNVEEIFADPRASEPTDDKWVVVKALKQFVENEGHGMLPVQGSLPDMAALTDDFLALQKIYHDKAEADFSAVLKYAQQIKPVPETLVRQMCKNASTLTLITYPPIHSVPSNAPAFSDDFCPMEETILTYSWAVALEAAELFAKQHEGRYPGDYPAASTRKEDLEQDTKELSTIVSSMLKERKFPDDMFCSEVVPEMVRCGGKEMHCVSTVMGALAGQEIVKLITHYFVPLDNCAVYNGVICQVTSHKIPNA